MSSNIEKLLLQNVLSESKIPQRAHPSMYRTSKRRMSKKPLKTSSFTSNYFPDNEVIIIGSDPRKAIYNKCRKEFNQCMNKKHGTRARVSERKYTKKSKPRVVVKAIPVKSKVKASKKKHNRKHTKKHNKKHTKRNNKHKKKFSILNIFS
jgi:hypothetical protein